MSLLALSRSWTHSLCLGACALSLLVGCAPLSSGDKDPLEGVDQMQPYATCHVLVESGWGKSTAKEVKLDRPMTVQDVLSEADVLRRFSNFHIEVERIIPGKRAPLRMPVTYEPRQRAVSFETDYAIMPNDRIYVSRNNNTPFDKVLESIGGPGFGE